MAHEYMIFIMERVSDFDDFSPEQEAALDERHRQFVKHVEDAGGAIIGGDPLDKPEPLDRFTPQPDGTVLATDGPFAESKEVVLGYYKIRAENDEQARAFAALCPTARYVELRRVLPTGASVANDR